MRLFLVLFKYKLKSTHNIQSQLLHGSINSGEIGMKWLLWDEIVTDADVRVNLDISYLVCFKINLVIKQSPKMSTFL